VKSIEKKSPLVMDRRGIDGYLATAILALGLCITSHSAEFPDLVKNGSFETLEGNKIANWEGVPFTISSSAQFATDGKLSMKLESGTEELSPIAAQDITDFSPNVKYRLQYEVRTAKFGQEYRSYIGCWKGKEWLSGVDVAWRQGMESGQKVFTDFVPPKDTDRLMVVLQLKGPGTAWFDHVSVAPLPAEKTLAPLPPFVGGEGFVQISNDRRFKVQGKPFFPIKIGGWSPWAEQDLAAAHDFGFNMVNAGTHVESLGGGGARLALDMASKYQLKAMLITRFEFNDKSIEARLPDKLEKIGAIVAKIHNHPALFAYDLTDEPAWAGYNLRGVAEGAWLLRKLDPNHPIYINHAPRNKIAELQRYNQYADIAGSDIYPVWKDGVDKHSDLPNKTLSVTGDEVIKNLEALAPGKPVLEIIQAFSWSDNCATMKVIHPFPTHAQLRFMGYDAVVCGANGITYYQDHRYPQLRSELKPVVREFAGLQDILAGGTALTVESVCAAPEIRLLALRHEGRTVVIAVNRGNKAIQAGLALRKWFEQAPSSLTVVFEKRMVPVVDGIASDSFKPFDVHVYSDCPDESKLLRQVVPIEVDTEAAVDSQAKYDALVPKTRRDLALAANGVKAFASTELGQMKACVVNDGDRWQGQWNDTTPYTYPDWVGLAFPKPVHIDRIAVFTRQLDMFGKWFQEGVRDYEVQIDNNGQWQTVKCVRGSEDFVTIIDFAPVTTSKIRLFITATNGSGDYSRVMEIEVYGPEKQT